MNLNSPGTYLNWNVFTISVANLVLIGPSTSGGRHSAEGTCAGHGYGVCSAA